MEHEFIQFEQSGYVAVITINRPEALNALNTKVLEELEKTIRESEATKEVRAYIITGAGKAFVAGADISQMKDMNLEDALDFARVGNRVLSLIENLDTPVIAAVNGYALGGGCELAIACHMRYASTKAKFAQPEVTLGITPGFGGTQRLPRAIGAGRAMEMILTGLPITAEQAFHYDLVNAVFEPDQLMTNVMKIAQAIACNAPIAVRYAKEAIQRVGLVNMRNDLDHESRRFAMCFSTADQKAAMTAFVEKAPRPEFIGK